MPPRSSDAWPDEALSFSGGKGFFLNYQQMVEVSGSLFTFLSFSLLLTVLNNPKEIFVILLYFPSFTQIQISSVAELLC